MAENNEYHIYVHIDGAEDKKSAVASAGTGSTGGSSAGSSDSGAEKIANKVKALVSFAAVKSTADSLVNYKISQVSLETGATQYEERMSFTYNLASQGVGAGAAILGGFVMGGPAGAVVAAIGVAASVGKQFIGYVQKSQTLETEQSLENISIGMQAVRAGVSSRRSANQ